jgi:hypothetical protein
VRAAIDCEASAENFEGSVISVARFLRFYELGLCFRNTNKTKNGIIGLR